MTSNQLQSLWKTIGDKIEKDKEDLVSLCLRLGSISSPAGEEKLACESFVSWMKENGIYAWSQPITETSANGVGILEGGGNGKSLIFDAHLDTGVLGSIGEGEKAKQMETGFVEGGLIYGHGIVNDKAQVAAFMIAARALHKAKIRLNGDLIIAAVAFETGAPSVDEFQGISRPGEGFGSRWLIDRGVVADYALIGETSGFGIVAAECGRAEFRIRIPGRPLYTPRVVRGKTWQESSNAFTKAANLAVALEDWATKYEAREKLDFYGGTINPKAQVIGIRGNEQSGIRGSDCYIYFDVWLLPGKNPRIVHGELKNFMGNLGVQGEISLFQWSRGYIAQQAEPLITAVKDAHRYLFGTEPPSPPTATLSMWRDLNAFNEVGIPSICYGPPRQKEMHTYEQNRAMKISDLVEASKVYAMTAMSVCGLAPP